MANDLTAMIFRIAAELGARFDLAGAAGSATPSTPNSEAIRNAINTAISIYQKQRFRFNEVDPSNPITFTTIAGDFDLLYRRQSLHFVVLLSSIISTSRSATR